jgi:prepilin-type N-terminal cleavage/methylation domain-containing protein
MPTRSPHSPRAGFTLVEVLVVVAIVTVGLGLMTNTLVAVGELGPVSRETSIAMDSARSMVEELRAVDFDAIFATYNDDPEDDPGGPGTAPGSAFAVSGLDLVDGDADGVAGEIAFAVLGAKLREDSADWRLGHPRDLNLDGAVDGDDHSGDYEILPFVVRVRWKGRSGNRSIDLYSAIVRP